MLSGMTVSTGASAGPKRPPAALRHLACTQEFRRSILQGAPSIRPQEDVNTNKKKRASLRRSRR